MDYQVSDSATLVPRQMARASGMWDARIAWLNWLHDALFMNNYHVTRCQELVNNPNVSGELKMIAEALVAMASGIDDADSMAQQALERIDICLERLQAVERRLELIEGRQGA